ncbi:hypothetical protein [Rhodovulum euryhalinum]|uniref:Uncharacterized protein n=1 Tax=Rhodovulum euryhalinum TaxID=35805 RepID=A0A4R2KIG1_9RHOB|nr:hypothetical protein [Rhodovulum euryhalinum]TCO70316.1 hypothetical protein EV655_11081 [Rhodovulum euryhalinum]
MAASRPNDPPPAPPKQAQTGGTRPTPEPIREPVFPDWASI